jgi:hypothetical protein
MCVAIPPLPNTPSWSGVQLKHRDDFYRSEVSITQTLELITGGCTRQVSGPQPLDREPAVCSGGKIAGYLATQYQLLLYSVA